MAKSIGGFFELELPKGGSPYHANAIALSTGRACLRLMLHNMSIRKCYVPYYTCDAVFHPFEAESVEMEEYGINTQFDPIYLPKLKDGEYFLYINYFGTKSQTVERLLSLYGDRLIIDNTHLFFHQGYEHNWSFTSARKYFGVPDGAYLYSPVDIQKLPPRFNEISISHNFHRLIGQQSLAHQEYTAYEKSLNCDINSISTLSEQLLSVVDFEFVRQRRLENYYYLHKAFKDINVFHAPDYLDDGPFAYPLITQHTVEKSKFYEQGLFIPSLWADPLRRPKDGFETDLMIARNLLPLPIDHRYDLNDMQYIADFVLKVVNGI